MISAMRNWRIWGMSTLAVLLSCCSPSAQPTALTGTDALIKSGIIGHWAVACDADHSSLNPHLIYEIPSIGSPTEQLLMDTQHDRTTPIENIKGYSNGLIEWTQTTPRDRVTVLTKVAGTRQKTWTSTLSDGSVLISDGRYEGGGEAPWFNKCPKE